MSINRKIRDELNKEADNNANMQLGSIKDLIGGINTPKPAPVTHKAKVETKKDIKDTNINKDNNKIINEEQIGYMSMRIPVSLKHEWKKFCFEHNMSLTECMKQAMSLMTELEQENKIKVENNKLIRL